MGEAYSAFLPLPVLGELYFGAFSSQRPEHQVGLFRGATLRWPILTPDEDTARIYGQLRVSTGSAAPIKPSKMNDFWIAALCIQHALPLLTNDRGFDHVAGLTVIHW